ncbi:hypothetical protein O9993_00435 [Vibrio lentus]|nr:hypothetical protein [Vibrio lentus]
MRIGLLTQKLNRPASESSFAREYRHWNITLNLVNSHGRKAHPFSLDESELNNADVFAMISVNQVEGFHFHFDVTPA